MIQSRRRRVRQPTGSRVLIIGTGPVAAVIAAQLSRDCHITVATRAPKLLEQRLGSRQRYVWRPRTIWPDVEFVALEGLCGQWDLIISTAPPSSDAVRAVIGRSRAGAVVAVTQVPSEVAEFKRITGYIPWGILSPGFLAWGCEPTLWWATGRPFQVSGPAAAAVRCAFRCPPPRAELARQLDAAATLIPVIAGLEAGGFDMRLGMRQAARLARAADEARRAVAISQGTKTPRSIPWPLVGAVLRGAPVLAPMDLPEYLEAHFGKYRDQTLRLLSDWITVARQHGIAHETLLELRTALTPSKDPARTSCI